MKITDEIVKALQNCIHGLGSINEFAKQANVNIETVSKYLGRKTKSITDDTWEQIYPLLRPYLPKGSYVKEKKNAGHGARHIEIDHKHATLSTDEQILLDAFAELSEETKKKKLIDIVEAARIEFQKKKQQAI
jgi:hypothetical protein